MMRHPSDERLLDIALGGGGEEDVHVRACPTCAERTREVRAGLDLALEADVPEPSALYWEALRKNVGRRIAEDPRRRLPWAWLVPLATAATALAVAVTVGHLPRPTERPPAAVLPAWTALPPADEDPGLLVLEGVAESTGTDLTAWEEGRGLGAFLAGLSDSESRAVVDGLDNSEVEGDL
jgi:hypothetical protein